MTTEICYIGSICMRRRVPFLFAINDLPVFTRLLEASREEFKS